MKFNKNKRRINTRKDIVMSPQDYVCGYCKHEFTKDLRYYIEKGTMKIMTVHVVCPRCGNYLKRDE